MGVAVGVGVGLITDAEADGFTDADAAFVATLDAAREALFAAWLLLVDDVQPDTNKAAATINRTVITAVGFDCIRLCKWRMVA